LRTKISYCTTVAASVPYWHFRALIPTMSMSASGGKEDIPDPLSNAAFSRGGDMAMDMLAPGVPIKELEVTGARADEQAKGTPKGYEVSSELFSINGKMLGAGEPIRVKQGERVLFHVLDASATEIRSLALPGHVFRVVALDGNPVPTPAA